MPLFGEVHSHCLNGVPLSVIAQSLKYSAHMCLTGDPVMHPLSISEGSVPSLFAQPSQLMKCVLSLYDAPLSAHLYLTSVLSFTLC